MTIMACLIPAESPRVPSGAANAKETAEKEAKGLGWPLQMDFSSTKSYVFYVNVAGNDMLPK